MTQKFGKVADVDGSVTVRTTRGLSANVQLLEVTLPSGGRLRLTLDDADRLLAALSAEIERLRGPA
jgi:YD repeat-containing protein